jgi:hypothetical protein
MDISCSALSRPSTRRETTKEADLPVVQDASQREDFVDVLAPVLQIMPELQELCEEPTSPMSVVHPKVDSFETLTSPLKPSQPLAFMKMGGLDVASVPQAFFAKKLCDLIASLEAASLGSGKTIGCLLRANASRGKKKKARRLVL